MLTTQYIRLQTQKVKKGLSLRNWKEQKIQIIDTIIETDNQRKDLKTQLDSILSKRNALSKQIGQLMRKGQKNEVENIKSLVTQLNNEREGVEKQLDEVSSKLEEHLLTIPNIPHESVPPGKGEEDNEVFKDWDGVLPSLTEGAKPHWELAKDFKLFDMEAGVKIAGAGFILYRANGAKLQRALINFFLDKASEAGYEEIMPPHLVNEDTARGTGQLPDKEGQMYHVAEDDLYLIPTAEVPLTNIVRGDIVQEEDLPIKFTGYTPCFRREAGSYGSHVRGLNRVHQFDKVEIVHISHPDKSYEALDVMVTHVENILIDLNLPYRILRLSGGDLGFTSALTFDFEVWSAAQERWLEVSSVSNFETFQSNRLKLKYKNKTTKKTELLHTLNGSALALTRIVATIIENNQTKDGIKIPKILQSYLGGKKILS